MKFITKKKLFVLIITIFLKSNLTLGQQIIELNNYKWEYRDLIRAYDNAFIKKDGIGGFSINLKSISDNNIKAIKFDLVIYDIFGKKIMKKKNIEISNFYSYNYYHIFEVGNWPPPFAQISNFKNDVKVFNQIENSNEIKVKLKIKDVVFSKNLSNNFEKNYEKILTRHF